MQPTTARWVFIALFCMLSALRLYFRIRSGLFREAFFSPSEPVASIIGRCILGAPLIAGTTVYCFFPGLWPWAYLTTTAGLRIGGTALSACALLLLAIVHRALGSAFTTGPAPRENRRLVTAGPYAFVRHPMYVAYFLLFLASFPLTGSWLIAASGLGVIGLLMTWRRRLEEALLFDRFGEEYARYHASTGAFLPRLRHRLKRLRQDITEQAYALYLACRDPRTPWYAKALALAVAAYAFSPIDLIPDFIPVLGYLDDLVIVPLGIMLAMRLVPVAVLVDCREKARQRMAAGMPTSRAGAAIVVAVWIGVLVAVACVVVKRLRRR